MATKQDYLPDQWVERERCDVCGHVLEANEDGRWYCTHCVCPNCMRSDGPEHACPGE